VLIVNFLHQSKSKLTSAELAGFWTQYINETAGLCFHKHMLEQPHLIEDRTALAMKDK
jgi:hypothetical protein